MYEVSAQQQDNLDKNFTYHKPHSDQPERYQQIRNRVKDLAELFVKLSPTSREQSLALTKLEEACMWVNAAIARNEVYVPEAAPAPAADKTA